jgi:hypothetical protein
MNECTECQNKQRIEAIERQLEENRESHKDIFERIERISEAKVKTDTTLDNVQRMVEEIRVDVKTLKEKPVKRYETAVNQILQYIITAILAYIALKIGIGG